MTQQEFNEKYKQYIPEEEAFELVVLFQDKINGVRKELAKKQAIMAASRIKEEVLKVVSEEDSTIHNIYWNRVLDEIQKL
jgi:hypothetical protein